MGRAVPAARKRPDMIERRYEYANWLMMLGVITTASSLTNVATTSGQREVMEGRELGNVLIVKF